MTNHKRITEKLAGLVWDQIDQQTDKGILRTISECEGLTTTNCGWVAYNLKDLVLAISRNILQLRQEEEGKDDDKVKIQDDNNGY